MEPFRILVDRYVNAHLPDIFEKEQKHDMWHILEQTVLIDGSRQLISNAIKIYTRSVFEAINDTDASEIKFFQIDKGSII